MLLTSDVLTPGLALGAPPPFTLSSSTASFAPLYPASQMNRNLLVPGAKMPFVSGIAAMAAGGRACSTAGAGGCCSGVA
eukprot:364267-Chlamydomonas_euryale.AAC.2